MTQQEKTIFLSRYHQLFSPSIHHWWTRFFCFTSMWNCSITSQCSCKFSLTFFDREASLRFFRSQITWVYRPKIPPNNGIKWLPLYANARRLTQNNQRFIVDYTGYEERTRKHISVLTINQLNLADEGTYMCKSNQHQSTANIFNVTVTGKDKRSSIVV